MKPQLMNSERGYLGNCLFHVFINSRDQILTILIFFVLFGCNVKPAPNEVTAPTQDEIIKKGEYLVATGGCDDCHSPKLFTEKGIEPDMSRRLSGHPEDAKLPEINKASLTPGNWLSFSSDLTAFIGPWGMSFARNLTPDETGIKGWTEDVFKNALRTGKHMGMDMGRPIMPPMPWQVIGKFNDEDLHAIFTYLGTIKPIRNHVPEPIPPDKL